MLCDNLANHCEPKGHSGLALDFLRQARVITDLSMLKCLQFNVTNPDRLQCFPVPNRLQCFPVPNRRNWQAALAQLPNLEVLVFDGSVSVSDWDGHDQAAVRTAQRRQPLCV